MGLRPKLSFAIDRLGRVSDLSVEPDTGNPPRSFFRRLVRLYVPAEFPESPVQGWTWTADDLDLMGRSTPWNLPGGPNTVLPPEPGTVSVERTTLVPGPDERDIAAAASVPAMEVDLFVPTIEGSPVSWVYSAVFALAEDGLTLCGNVFGGEIPWRARMDLFSDTPSWGHEVQARIVREGNEVPPWIVRAVDSRASQRIEKRLSELPHPDSRTPTDVAIEEEMRLRSAPPPAPELPIELDSSSINGVLAALDYVRGHLTDGMEHEIGVSLGRVLRELARRASSDDDVRDRLFRIAAEWHDPGHRKIALFTLGLMEQPDVRQRLLDIAESAETPVELAAAALDAVFKSPKSGVYSWKGVIESGDQPVSDPRVIERVIDLSRRADLPRPLLFEACEGLAESQKVFPEGSDNPASKRLREVAASGPDEKMRKMAVDALGGFPSVENFETLARLYRETPETGNDGLKRLAAQRMQARFVQSQTLARDLDRILLDLGEGSVPLRDLAPLLESVNMRGLDQERFLRIVEKAVFETQPARGETQHWSKIVQDLEHVVGSRDRDFMLRVRELLSRAQARFPALKYPVERATSQIDRYIK